jgi:hypothetical protein
LIAKSQPLQSQGLAINPKPSITQNPNSPREEESQPFEFSCENDLFDDDFGKSFDFQFCKMLSSEYNSKLLKKGSLRKCPYPHLVHQKEFKDGMSSSAIEGELSHLEVNPIFSPSMPTLDVLSEPIF